MLSFRLAHECLFAVQGYRRVLGSLFVSNCLPKDQFPSVLAVEISVVKCAFLPSLEKCYVGEVENGYFPGRGWDDFYKEGERVRYVCYNDYQAQHEEVTCTKNGWAPAPRCTRKSECACILVRFLSKTLCCNGNF